MYVILTGQKYIILLISKRYLCFLHGWTKASKEISIVDNALLGFNPSWELSTTQLLAHSHPSWMGETIGRVKVRKLMG